MRRKEVPFAISRNIIKVPSAFRAELYLAARAWHFDAIARPCILYDTVTCDRMSQ